MNRFLDRHGILDADYERAAKDDATFEALLLPDRKPTPLAGNALVVVDSSDAPAAALATPQEASSRRLARSAKRADHVKSQVLYEIWRLFQQQGIRIPYPKRDLYVRSDVPATFAEAGDRRHRLS